jgi:hypothetical protein
MKRKDGNRSKVLNEQLELNRSILNRIFANSSSVLASRMSYGNTQTFDGLRDVYTSLGYPAVDKISYNDFYAKYKRQDVAATIIDKPVFGAWKRTPIIKTKGEDIEDDPFRTEWELLADRFKLFSLFQRVDKLAGIGRYAILYMGVQDGSNRPFEPLNNSGKLLYIQPYSEGNAPIKTAVSDPMHERFSLPDKYSLRSVQVVAGNIDTKAYNEIDVDSSRIIHIADNLLENNVYGMSRLEKVYNRLLNLELIVGGSAEMFWQGAFPGLAFTTRDDYNLTEQTSADLTEQIKAYVHQLERYMKLQGIDVQSLSNTIADPGSHVDVQLTMLSIATGIPKRIFQGSERGELASSQDTKAWNEFCDNRRRSFCEPSIIIPVVDKLIEIGELPEPAGGEYEIEWPDLETASDKDKADIGKVRSEAIRGYAQTPDAQLIVPPKSFLQDIMELEPDKVERIMSEMEDMMTDMFRMEETGDIEAQEEREEDTEE